jgi:putative phage-type endonuclease
MQANRITLEQGTTEWHEFRRGKISASKVPIILGLSPYASPLQLYEEEMGLREPKAQSKHMTDGLEVEQKVRDWFFDQYHVEVFPCVLQSIENPLFIASLDGMSADGKTIVEIKNNNKDSHEMARNGILPANYAAQVQFQMFVCGLIECFYISHRQGDYAVVVVKRDQDYIDEMIPKLLDFKRRLTDFDPPPMTERDYEDMSDDSDLYGIVARYKRATEAIKQAENDAEYYRRLIKERVGEKNAKGQGWKFTRYQVQGRVDYDAVLRQYNVDANLEQFRKKGSFSYRLTIE